MKAVEVAVREKQSSVARYERRIDGHDHVFRVTVTPADAALIVSFEDLTEAENAMQMRRDFVANVSHELRTPLTAILGFIETLQGPARNDAEAQGRFLAVMEQEAARMARLVDDLLSLSRVEDNERRRPTDPVNLIEVLHATAEALAPLLADAQQKLQFDHVLPEIMVPGDAGQLRQVFHNLIENAVKYAPEGKTVDVAISGPERDPILRTEAVFISVSDHGQGIDARHLARLTERFYRVDDHRSREVGGTGLGLAIVKHILNRHRGRLIVTSPAGKGAVFTVALPVRTSE